MVPGAARKRTGARQTPPSAVSRLSSLYRPGECSGNRRALISGDRGRIHAAPGTWWSPAPRRGRWTLVGGGHSRGA